MGESPAVVQHEGGEAALSMERCSPAPVLDAVSIDKQALIELLGRP